MDNKKHKIKSLMIKLLRQMLNYDLK